MTELLKKVSETDRVECIWCAASYSSLTDIPQQCGQKESLAQRFKQSQSTRKRNGEAILKSNMANYLISQINCSFSGGWCGKYSTRTVNTSVQTAEARVNVSHGFPHKHVLLLKQTGLIRFHQLLLYSVCTFSLFEALVFSSVLLWRNKKKPIKNKNKALQTLKG